MPKHHVIISGTGRAGTTFLMQLLTMLGLGTGFSDVTSGVYAHCNAGMEWDIRRADAPYVVKSPWLCDCLDEVLDAGDVVLDHAIIPVRDLYAAAESRRSVSRRSGAGQYGDLVPGGLWRTDDPARQEDVLTHQLYKIIHTIAKRDIPLTLLHFPRLLQEPDYLFKRLGTLLNGTDYDAFLRAFNEVAQPHLVHQFTPSAADQASD